MENKILVLGATGMVGRVVYFYLSRAYQTFGTVRKQQKNLTKYNFPEDNRVLEKHIKENNINVVINCIGVLRTKQSLEANYKLPIFLAKLSEKYNFQIINISTDDVFSPNSGIVDEKDKPFPDSAYGKSKLKGEIKSPNIINVRTSFIGFDPIKKKGLLEWLIKEKDRTVDGYVNQTWSGCTTLQFAKLCKQLIKISNYSTIHFVPLGPTTKYQLLADISKSLKVNAKIIKASSNEINRILASTYFDSGELKKYTTDTKKAILELNNFEKSL